MNTQIRDMQNKNSQSDQIHLKDYLNIIKKRKWMVVLFSVVLIGLVAAYSFLATPIFEATAQIIIDYQMYPVTNAEQGLNTDIRESDYYQTQYNLLQSRSLALKVIKDLDLLKVYQSEQPSTKSDKTQAVKSVVTWLSSKIGQKPISKSAQEQAVPASSSDWSDVIDWYYKNLKIEPVKLSRLINISFRSKSPEIAAKVANSHANAFIAWTTEMKMSASQQKLNWLKQQPQAQDNKTVSNPAGSSSSNSKYENIFSLPEVAQDPVILNLRNLLIQLTAKRLELASNFGLKHPKMIELNAQIAQVEKDIAEQAQRVSRVVSNSFQTSNISIVDEAEIPLDPVKPRKALNILLAIIVSMFMGPFLAFFVEYMDRTVKTPEDVQRCLGMTVLGAVPVYKSLRNRNNGLLNWEEAGPINIKKSKYSYAGDMAARYIPGLLSIWKQPKGNVLFIASATSGEGKTTVLANAAISLAHRGVRVLVIDTDVFNPALHAVFGVNNDSGLASLFTRMLAQTIRSGDLNAYSVDDLFFLIALKRLGGSLSVTNDAQTMIAQFEDGRLLDLQSKMSPSDNRLGTMLLRGGLITEGQLEYALDWQKRTGQPLGYILINSGYLTPERLHGPIKLQMEENLQRLFSWKQGTFTFEQSSTSGMAQDEKIYHQEDYTDIIERLGREAGSRFIEQELFSHIIQATDPDIWILPAGTREMKPRVGSTSLMLFSKFLEVLKPKFDVIFVDAPPVLDMPDSAAFARQGDGVIFVAKAGKLSDKTIITATERLQESGAKILGLVLNHAKLDREYYA